MKCSLKCAGVAVVVLLVAAVIIPQYSDYRGYAETDQWLVQLRPLQEAIEANAIRKKSLSGAGKEIAKPRLAHDNVTIFEVTDSGVILVKGGRDGQVLVLVPSFEAEKVVWRCVGGPAKDVSATGCAWTMEGKNN